MKKLIDINDKMLERLKQVQIEIAIKTGCVPSMQNVIYNMIISGLNVYEEGEEGNDKDN